MLMNRTLKSILTDPLISQISADAIKNMDLSKEEYYNWTLQEIADKMGWHSLNSGFTKLFEVARTGNYYFNLYSEDEVLADPEKKGANFVYFPSKDEKAKDRPFIVLIPGGGFVNVWNITEGWPIANIYNELGYNVFIITYRVMVDGCAVKAMEDISRAMKIINSKKDEFGVDPNRYITCGFSAGGYVLCLWNSDKGYRAYDMPKPLACFPIYPVTSFRIIRDNMWDPKAKEDCAMGSVGCSIDKACESSFEIPEHVEGFPPTAIFLAAEDDLVNPLHSKNLAKALEEAGIPCRLEIGPAGGHGFSDGKGMCMEGWPERAIEWFENL